MRLLVTGVNGQVARALRASPAPSGVELVFAGRPDLDLERPETIAATVAQVAPDAVLSLAAYTAVDAAEADPERAFRVNARAPQVLAEEARRSGAPMLHLSTDYVFDGTKPAPYVETDATGPATVYGASKLAGERGVAAAQPESLVLRTSWVHAPWGHNFVRTMLRLAETRDEVAVVCDQRGCPTYAPDLAARLLTLAAGAAARAGPFGTFHLTGEGQASWAEFAAAVFQGAQARGAPSARVRPVPTEQFPITARRPLNSRLDCSEIARQWGVRMPDWRDGLNRSLDALLGSVVDGDTT